MSRLSKGGTQSTLYSVQFARKSICMPPSVSLLHVVCPFACRNWWHTHMTWLCVVLPLWPSPRVDVCCWLAMTTSTAMFGTPWKATGWVCLLGTTTGSAVWVSQRTALPLQQAPGIHSSKSGIRERPGHLLFFCYVALCFPRRLYGLLYTVPHIWYYMVTFSFDCMCSCTVLIMYALFTVSCHIHTYMC